jgi:hypothetical protein
MKKIAVLLCVMGIVGSSISFADSVCVSKIAMLNCNPGSVDSISFTGMVDVNGTTVVNGFSVWGNVNVMNAKLNSLNIKGNTNISNTNVNGEVSLAGTLTMNEVDFRNASSFLGELFGGHVTFYSTSKIVGTIDCSACTFKGDTTLIGEITLVDSELSTAAEMNFRNANFSNTIVNDVVVEQSDHDIEQTMHLKSGSKVHNVTFEGGKGIVILSGNSEITGYLKGGKIQKS